MCIPKLPKRSRNKYRRMHAAHFCMLCVCVCTVIYDMCCMLCVLYRSINTMPCYTRKLSCYTTGSDWICAQNQIELFDMLNTVIEHLLYHLNIPINASNHSATECDSLTTSMTMTSEEELVKHVESRIERMAIATYHWIKMTVHTSYIPFRFTQSTPSPSTLTSFSPVFGYIGGWHVDCMP